MESLRGVTTLYNTYWVRFSYKGVTFDRAVENSIKLVKAAENAGVRRIVHLTGTRQAATYSEGLQSGSNIQDEVLLLSLL